MDRLNPRVDFAFKKLFGTQENSELLISLINSIVSEKDQVRQIEIKNPYNTKNFGKDKLSILDVKAQDLPGKWFNIEMQIADQDCFDRRALYYWSRLYNSQLLEGIHYDQLAKTISINILNFNCLKQLTYHSTYKILDIKTGDEYLDHLEIHFVELEKYHGDLTEVMTSLERWMVFLKRAHEFSKSRLPKQLAEVNQIAKAVEVLETMSLDDEEREVYEARLKWIRDEEMAIRTAHNKGLKAGMAEGLKEGLERGLAEGIAQGIAQGIEQGIEQGRSDAIKEAFNKLIASGISEELAKKILEI